NNIVQTWAGNFTFGGTSSLNLGTGAITLTASPTITVNNNVLTAGGAIGGGAFGITKAGTGTLTLNGNSTYSNGLTVNAGTVPLGNVNAAGSGAITLASGTSLVSSITTGGSIANALT